MKFYSETLKKLFDSEESLKEAENSAKEQKVKSKSIKASYAKAVEDARTESIDATKEYKQAVDLFNKKCEELYKTIVTPAKKKKDEASRKSYEALREFNKRYGVYTKRYTDEDVDKLSKYIEYDIFDTPLFDTPFFMF